MAWWNLGFKSPWLHCEPRFPPGFFFAPILVDGDVYGLSAEVVASFSPLRIVPRQLSQR
jgi:hypothetical protein